MYDPTHHLDMFRSARRFLFRGTRTARSYGDTYTGNGVTPTSIDPIVATLYAARYRSEGPAIFLILEKDAFKDRIDGPSVTSFAGMELAVNLDVTPMKAEQEALKIVSVDDCLRIIREMGHEMPEILRDLGALREALRYSPRLSPDEVDFFSKQALEIH